MKGEELFLNELNFHIRSGLSKKDLTDLVNERLKQLTLTDVVASLPKCKNYVNGQCTECELNHHKECNG